MKALTIKQPWAWAIMAGHKRVENRTWPCGIASQWLLIHSARNASRAYLHESLGHLRMGGVSWMKLDRWQDVRGAILGAVWLKGCQRGPLNMSFAEGPWCYLLDQVVTLDQPIPYQGQLGFFNVPDDVLPDSFRRKLARLVEKGVVAKRKRISSRRRSGGGKSDAKGKPSGGRSKQ